MSGCQGVGVEVDDNLSRCAVSTAATQVRADIAPEEHDPAENRGDRDDHNNPLHGGTEEPASLDIVALSAGCMALRGCACGARSRRHALIQDDDEPAVTRFREPFEYASPVPCVPAPALQRSFPGQTNAKPRPAEGSIEHLDRSVVPIDDVAHDGEAKPGASRPALA